MLIGNLISGNYTFIQSFKFKVKFEIYILGFVGDDTDILTVQDNAYTIAVDIMAKIDTDEANRGVLSVYDYSILTLARYTDDSSAGVKLSLVLSMPNPVDLCELDDNFDEEPHDQTEPDIDIDIDIENVDDIDIMPITLPRNRQC